MFTTALGRRERYASNYKVCQILGGLRGDIGGAEVTKVTCPHLARAANYIVIGRICTSGPCEAMLALRSMFADGIPVRWNDFSQSEADGPRMLPSM